MLSLRKRHRHRHRAGSSIIRDSESCLLPFLNERCPPPAIPSTELNLCTYVPTLIHTTAFPSPQDQPSHQPPTAPYPPPFIQTGSLICAPTQTLSTSAEATSYPLGRWSGAVKTVKRRCVRGSRRDCGIGVWGCVRGVWIGVIGWTKRLKRRGRTREGKVRNDRGMW
jgi:hypothetical protein